MNCGLPTNLAVMGSGKATAAAFHPTVETWKDSDTDLRVTQPDGYLCKVTILLMPGVVTPHQLMPVFPCIHAIPPDLGPLERASGSQSATPDGLFRTSLTLTTLT